MFVTEVLKPESKHLLCHTCPFSTKDQEAMDLHLLTYHKAKAKDSENFNFKKVSVCLIIIFILFHLISFFWL